MNYIPKNEEDKKEMLNFLGKKDVLELFSDIPKNLLLKEKLKIPDAMSEQELLKHMYSLAQKNMNATSHSCFLGAGYYNHYVPSTVDEIISRAEFYTAYTPYQAEVSQGTLQAIYEYQSLICELTGMDASNASVYDGSTALAEAGLMTKRIKGKTDEAELLVSKAIHPEYKAVVQTYANANGIKLTEIELENGLTSFEDAKSKLNQNVTGILIQSPNFFGGVENVKQFSELAHSNKSMLVAAVVEPTSLAILQPPGNLGADIVVGEGQCFGTGMSFGGPSLGFMAVKKDFIRNLSGRISGRTTDTEGRIGYVLTLQAREQHIRREKAASNICTNQGLVMLAATVGMVSLGRKGLTNMALHSTQKAHYLAKKLKEANKQLLFTSPFYNEFAVKFENGEKTRQKLVENGFMPPLNLGKYYSKYNNSLLFCTTEMTSIEKIDKLVELVE